MKHFLITLSAIILVSAFSMRANNLSVQNTDSLINLQQHLLQTCDTPQDSLKAYFNIFDLRGRQRDSKNCYDVYALARKIGDERAQLEMLRNLSVINSNNDSLINIYLDAALKLPPSDLRAESIAFIRITSASDQNEDSDADAETRRINRINNLISRYRELDPDKSTPIARAELLFTICVNLSRSASGQMLKDHLTQLENAINAIPSRHGILRYQFYNFALSAYQAMGDKAKVLDLSKKFLKYISNLQQQYRTRGRKYRKFDIYRFRIYSQILGCYPILSTQQIENSYERVRQIIERDPDSQTEFNRNHTAEIFYLMAHKEYARALPLLNEVMLSDNLKSLRPLFYESYVKAATETGDAEALDRALKLYNDALEYQLKDRALNSSRQLQILYDNRELNELKDQVEDRNRELELKQRRHLIWIVLIGGVILLVMIICVWIARRHTVRIARSLAENNRTLKAEKESLASAHRQLLAARDRANIADRSKTEFIHNISHEISDPTNAIVGYTQLIIDSIDSSKRTQLERYIKVIEHNASLLRSLVNDVLDSVDIESSRMSATVNNFSLAATVSTAIESVKPRLKPDVRITISPGTDNDSYLVDNDPRRVEQVIINMLTNAVKYTHKGTIDVAFDIDRDSHTATVTVTDTGIGIPKGYEESIFNRYGKVNRAESGLGIGLHVCRIISDLIGGRIYLDTSWAGGARFVFEFPSDGLRDPETGRDNHDAAGAASHMSSNDQD